MTKEAMTIWSLRKLYPCAEFRYYDADGWSRRPLGAHEPCERYEVKEYHHQEDGDEWTDQVVNIYYAY